MVNPSLFTQYKTPRIHELFRNEVFAFLRKPHSCSVIPRFLPNHGVIRRFLPWICSQVLCDHAYKIWWDLDLIWPFDHRVSQEWRAEKFVLGSGRIFRITGWTGACQWINRWSGFCSYLRFRVSGVLHRRRCFGIVGLTGVVVLLSPVYWALSFPRRINRCSVCLFCSLSGQLHRRWFQFCRIIRWSNTGWTDVVQTYTSDQPVPTSSLLPALWHRLNRWEFSSHVGLTGDHILCCFCCLLAVFDPISSRLVPRVFAWCLAQL